VWHTSCREHLDAQAARETFSTLVSSRQREDCRDAALFAVTLGLSEDFLGRAKVELFGRRVLYRSPDTNILWVPLLQMLLLWPRLRMALIAAEPTRVLRALTHIKNRSGRQVADNIVRQLSPTWQVCKCSDAERHGAYPTATIYSNPRTLQRVPERVPTYDITPGMCSPKPSGIGVFEYLQFPNSHRSYGTMSLLCIFELR
jgi:hypothetical protein